MWILQFQSLSMLRLHRICKIDHRNNIYPRWHSVPRRAGSVGSPGRESKEETEDSLGFTTHISLADRMLQRCGVILVVICPETCGLGSW